MHTHARTPAENESERVLELQRTYSQKEGERERDKERALEIARNI